MKKLIRRSKIGAVILCTALVSACSVTAGTGTDNGTEAVTAVTAEQGETVSAEPQAGVLMADLVTYDEEDRAVDWSADSSTTIELGGTSAAITGSGAEAADGSVTITAAGTYVLSGKLSEGQIIVDVPDEGTVRLVLNGVDIHDSDNAPVYVKEAGKTIVTLQEGTENIVSDGETYAFPDSSTDEPNAAIFSMADLTINGSGKLSVEANYNNGITSKDDLKIVEGTIEVQAADDGIMGRDMVAVEDGTITVAAGGDGIKSTNDADATKGWIAVAGGTFDIQAGSDGMQAETTLLIDGGTFTMVTGGGNANGTVKTSDNGQPGPRDSVASETDTQTAAEESASAKGLKAGGDISVNGGTFTIDSADDAVHSNTNAAVTQGDITITSGDDGIHADTAVTISGGTIAITKSYEGIEGANITVNGGDIQVTASDDGVNVAGGNDGSSVNGRPGQNSFSDTGSNLLTINGGTLTVNAAGDGLDANGSIAMTGGTVIANGPTSNGNGTLDYDGSFHMSGGYLVAAGSSGMAQGPTEESGQYSVIMTFSQARQAGEIVHLEDGEGNDIMTFAPAKDYQTVVVSSPDLKQGGSYTLYAGGTSTGSEAHGLYADGEYTGGTEIVGFEISDSVTWLSESGVTTGGGAMGGPGGGRTRPSGGGRM